jgi:rod shape-determining protein MreD
MSGYLSIPVLALAVIVQSTLVPEIRLGGAMPDLVFLLVLAWSLMAGFEQGLVWAMVGGILQDLVSAVPLGTTSLALVVVIALAGVVLGRINPRNLVYPSLAAGGGILVVHVITLVVLLVTGRAVPFIDLLLYVTLPSMVYNALVMLPVYRILGAFYTSSRPRRVEGL